MTARELLQLCGARLEHERRRLTAAGDESPIVATEARLVQTVGGLHLYEFSLPPDATLAVDLPVSVVPTDDIEPTEGVVLEQTGNRALIQLVDSLGAGAWSVTLLPDHTGQLQTSAGRLREMITKSDAYNLGPAERLVALIEAVERGEPAPASSSAVLQTVWLQDQGLRRQKLAMLVVEMIRANKRMLLLSPDHRESDATVGIIARTMKAAGLSHKMWISRYEMPITAQAGGLPLQELGFEAQMHQFYAKARAEKASLRRKYERFRELTPFLAYKGQKQKDLDEVRLLEWRLLTQLSELQTKMTAVKTTLAEYESLPLLRRLTMQAVGKNVESLHHYEAFYQKQIDELTKELDVAKARIEELVPEAAVPRDMRPEFEELKEDIAKLGGTKKIRELLAAEEDTNRQAFIQNRRVVAATPARVASDPLFSRVRFDVLIVDNAPRIALPALLAAAGLVRERIIVSGDPQELAPSRRWALNEAEAPAAS